MEWTRRYYDRSARNFNLDGAICYLLFFAFMLFLGVTELKAASRTSDSFYGYAGSVTVLGGALGIFHAWQVIRSVVRRLQSEARSTTNPIPR